METILSEILICIIKISSQKHNNCYCEHFKLIKKILSNLKLLSKTVLKIVILIENQIDNYLNHE